VVRARTPAARLATYAILALATVPLVRAGLAEPAGEDPRVAALERLVADAPPANDPVYAVMPATSEYHLDKFLPVVWLDDQDPISLGRPLDLRWFVEDGEHVGLALQQGSGEPVWHDIDCATRRCSAAVDGYRLASETVRAVPLEETTDVAGWVLVRWQPDWTRLGLDGGALLGALDTAGVACIRRNARP
jgi:hypothetical protein